MIEFILSVPALESFEFDYPSSYDHGFDIEPSRTRPLRCVSLSELQDFRVDSTFEAGLRMLSYLVFPLNAQLSFVLSDSMDTMDCYTANQLEGLMTCASAVIREHYAQENERGKPHGFVIIGSASVSTVLCHLGIPANLWYVPNLREAVASMYLTTAVFVDTPNLLVRGDVQGFTMRDLLCFKKVEELWLEDTAVVLFDTAVRNGDLPAGIRFPECTSLIIRGFDFATWPGTQAYGQAIPEIIDARLTEVLIAWRTFVEETRGVTLDIAFHQCPRSRSTKAAFRTFFGEDCVHDVDAFKAAYDRALGV